MTLQAILGSSTATGRVSLARQVEGEETG